MNKWAMRTKARYVRNVDSDLLDVYLKQNGATVVTSFGPNKFDPDHYTFTLIARRSTCDKPQLGLPYEFAIVRHRVNRPGLTRSTEYWSMIEHYAYCHPLDWHGCVDTRLWFDDNARVISRDTGLDGDSVNQWIVHAHSTLLILLLTLMMEQDKEPDQE